MRQDRIAAKMSSSAQTLNQPNTAAAPADTACRAWRRQSPSTTTAISTHTPYRISALRRRSQFSSRRAVVWRISDACRADVRYISCSSCIFVSAVAIDRCHRPAVGRRLFSSSLHASMEGPDKALLLLLLLLLIMTFAGRRRKGERFVLYLNAICLAHSDTNPDASKQVRVRICA